MLIHPPNRTNTAPACLILAVADRHQSSLFFLASGPTSTTKSLASRGNLSQIMTISRISTLTIPSPINLTSPRLYQTPKAIRGRSIDRQVATYSDPNTQLSHLPSSAEKPRHPSSPTFINLPRELSQPHRNSPSWPNKKSSPQHIPIWAQIEHPDSFTANFQMSLQDPHPSAHLALTLPTLKEPNPPQTPYTSRSMSDLQTTHPTVPHTPGPLLNHTSFHDTSDTPALLLSDTAETPLPQPLQNNLDPPQSAPKKLRTKPMALRRSQRILTKQKLNGGISKAPS